MNLFFTAFLQVFFVAISTACIANKNFPGAFGAAFAISYLWSANVKRAAIGTRKDRFVYAFGAAFGSVSGLLLTNFINQIFRYFNL